MHARRALTSAVVVAGLAVSTGACGAGEDAVDAVDETTIPVGEGIEVTQARADLESGLVPTAIYRQLLVELGYEVSDPAELELDPSEFYTVLAQGGADFWVNSWFPGHANWFATELPDGSLVGDHVTALGESMIEGGLHGYLITKSFADEYGITHLDQLNDDPEILAAYDAFDAKPGDGVAQIYGCQESFTCDDIIESQIAFSGWENIEQTIEGYDAMFGSAVAQVERDEPMVIYTWTPSMYVTELVPGENVVWLAVDDVIDDSNPLGVDGGEGHDQRPGTATIGPDQCPAAADHPEGLCQMGWIAADIKVTANNEFLAANPPARVLLEQVVLDVIAISEATAMFDDGAAPDVLAVQWIEQNREVVDEWLDAARAAAD